MTTDPKVCPNHGRFPAGCCPICGWEFSDSRSLNENAPLPSKERDLAELIGRLENLSDYEPDEAQQAIDSAVLALRSYAKRLGLPAVQTEVCPVCHTVHDDPRCPAPEPRIEPRCPRPCNGRPDDFTMAQCILAGECGCTKAACEARAAGETGAKPCTCHPDDNPPRPCPQKYALTECRQAAEGTTREPFAALKVRTVGERHNLSWSLNGSAPPDGEYALYCEPPAQQCEPAAWLVKLDDGWRYLGSTREDAEHTQRSTGGVLVPLYERSAEKTRDDGLCWIKGCQRLKGHEGFCDPLPAPDVKGDA